MKIGLMFAGQGAQTVGMGHDIYEAFPSAAKLFRHADELLKYDLTQAMFHGPAEELTKTAICQPALYVHGLALLSALKSVLPNFRFDAAAGLSLGEFTAYAAAGAFDFETGLRLVTQRARFMQEACEQTTGSMAAIIGAEETSVRDLAAATDVDIANLNCPGQIVISGEQSKIALAVSLAKEYGARKAVELKVAGAFHSRLMESAYERLRQELENTPLLPPSVPVVCNVDAIAVGDPSDIRRTLAEQVTGTVRWTESVQCLVNQQRCDVLLELGPGAILAGLVNRISKEVRVLNVSNKATLEEVVKSLTV
ncbi:MAG: [acyl-carrier-protein] S-malonyltransferase [Verrucomicrobia bacterium]|nr:MAG: [acyl-carrier-protein] S-malonyltransferase [Verrucomicrobiota bacterium]